MHKVIISITKCNNSQDLGNWYKIIYEGTISKRIVCRKKFVKTIKFKYSRLKMNMEE